jgi:hypothetical protein
MPGSWNSRINKQKEMRLTNAFGIAWLDIGAIVCKLFLSFSFGRHYAVED